MKVTLLFPPSWTPAMPHLALPSLTAYLRSHGVEVTQRDVNLESIDRILTRGHLRRVISRLRQLYAPGRKGPGLHAPTKLVEWALRNGPQVAGKVQAYKDVLRGNAFFEGKLGQEAMEQVIQALYLASVPFYPATLELSDVTNPPIEYRSEALLRAARDHEINIWSDVLRRGVVADLVRDPPDLVGISIPTAGQMLAGATLAALIKEEGLSCHITVGGPHVTVLREQIAKTPALFDIFDSVILFDGEVPLLRLCEALDDGGDLDAVPSLIRRGGDEIRVSERHEPIRMDDLPTPDFDGLPLDRYLAPGLVLPMATSRGCYHHRCAFCNVDDGLGHEFQQASAEHVVKQMLKVNERHPVDHIWFVDEAVTPRNLRGISEELERLGAPIDWSAYARFDPGMKRQLLEQMHRGGCRMLFFGLESASEKISHAMCKGIDMANVRRILRDSSEVGLWNHVFFFFGFPGETIEDAQETVNFFYQERPWIHSTAFGTFVLERYAPAFQSPAEHHIKQIIDDETRDLALWFNYVPSEGMDERTADAVYSAFLEALPAKEFGHYYLHDVYRILYAKRLHDQGEPYPPWLELG